MLVILQCTEDPLHLNKELSHSKCQGGIWQILAYSNENEPGNTHDMDKCKQNTEEKKKKKPAKRRAYSYKAQYQVN